MTWQWTDREIFISQIRATTASGLWTQSLESSIPSREPAVLDFRGTVGPPHWPNLEIQGAWRSREMFISWMAIMTVSEGWISSPELFPPWQETVLLVSRGTADRPLWPSYIRP